MLWDLIGSIAAFLTTFGFVPQTIRFYRTKSTEDVSLTTLVQFGVGQFLWLLYGWHIQDNIVLIANIISFSFQLVTIGLFFRYRRNRIKVL